MPNGRQEQVTTELPASSALEYTEMRKAGCRFEAEMLVTGEISVTITKGENDLDISLTVNGPAVQAGMAAMLSRHMWRKKARR
jgi:hypothetical protein